MIDLMASLWHPAIYIICGVCESAWMRMRIELALLQQNMSLRNRERVYFAFLEAEYAFFDFFGRRQIEAKENGIL